MIAKSGAVGDGTIYHGEAPPPPRADETAVAEKPSLSAVNDVRLRNKIQQTYRDRSFGECSTYFQM
jgi:hypothetical protein